MRRLRLFLGRRAVAEDAPFAHAHLEQAKVLAVLGGRMEARLAPGHAQSLTAIRPEDTTDDRLRRLGLRHGKPAREMFPSKLRSLRLLRPCLRKRASEVGTMQRNLVLRLVGKPRVGEEPLVAAEEPECLALVLNALGNGQSRLRRDVGRMCTRRRRQRSRGNDDERKRA